MYFWNSGAFTNVIIFVSSLWVLALSLLLYRSNTGFYMFVLWPFSPFASFHSFFFFFFFLLSSLENKYDSSTVAHSLITGPFP